MNIDHPFPANSLEDPFIVYNTDGDTDHLLPSSHPTSHQPFTPDSEQSFSQSFSHSSGSSTVSSDSSYSPPYSAFSQLAIASYSLPRDPRSPSPLPPRRYSVQTELRPHHEVDKHWLPHLAYLPAFSSNPPSAQISPPHQTPISNTWWDPNTPRLSFDQVTHSTASLLEAAVATAPEYAPSDTVSRAPSTPQRVPYALDALEIPTPPYSSSYIVPRRISHKFRDELAFSCPPTPDNNEQPTLPWSLQEHLEHAPGTRVPYTASTDDDDPFDGSIPSSPVATVYPFAVDEYTIPYPERHRNTLAVQDAYSDDSDSSDEENEIAIPHLPESPQTLRARALSPPMDAPSPHRSQCATSPHGSATYARPRGWPLSTSTFPASTRPSSPQVDPALINSQQPPSLQVTVAHMSHADDPEDDGETVHSPGAGSSTSGAHKRNFKTALWEAINNPDFEKLIRWDKDGLAGVIPDKKKFESSRAMRAITDARDFGGFARQLNMWNFTRGRHPDLGINSVRFTHDDFQRGREDLLDDMVRKGENKMSRPSKGKTNQKPVKKVKEVNKVHKPKNPNARHSTRLNVRPNYEETDDDNVDDPSSDDSTPVASPARARPSASAGPSRPAAKKMKLTTGARAITVLKSLKTQNDALEQENALLRSHVVEKNALQHEVSELRERMRGMYFQRMGGESSTSAPTGIRGLSPPPMVVAVPGRFKRVYEFTPEPPTGEIIGLGQWPESEMRSTSIKAGASSKSAKGKAPATASPSNKPPRSKRPRV